MKYKLFGANTGLPASELILGAASLGTRRGYGASAEDIPKILAAYADAGGNFFDIADQYQLGEAEEIVGRFTASNRHNYIICTKYTRSSEINPLPANEGNHCKAMRGAIEASLKRLKTDYIDIYMPHYDDGRTPIEEIARGLEDLVKAGKVLYTGLANFPAWKAAAIATTIPLTALQIEYNLVQRTADRELLGMARHFGLGTMLYSPLAGGLLTGKYRNGATGRLARSTSDNYEEDLTTKTIIDLLEELAAEVNATPGQIALAWALRQNAFPIMGARTLAHIADGLKAINIHLNHDQLTRLDNISAVNPGYPGTLLKTVQKAY
ncbi:oxidoreductase [Niastella yeongjuensis]|uniref:Oxidoreductase n=1 Tax=Niastella yeongjuensis TaxID=354355 RepID=A0A1V9EMC7_9BACT|nr:aldo/keto reductase [Niastella yeongjuensis]OQP47297.1 oxidoreductase [Niastella yeongjuensis]SEN77686.1 Predicted oxidoreductase [Niastella yeongjuensis]